MAEVISSECPCSLDISGYGAKVRQGVVGRDSEEKK